MRPSVGIAGAGTTAPQRPASRVRARSPAGPGASPSVRQNQASAFSFQNTGGNRPNGAAPSASSTREYSSGVFLPGSGSVGSKGNQVASNPQKPRDSRLSVVVRKRPMNRREAQSQQQDVVFCRNNQVIVREPKLKVDLTRYVEEHNFLFDQSFDEHVTNEQLYDACVRPAIDAVFSGAKCTCFAYGQTGSGKTFTMMGPHKRQTEGAADSEITPGIFLLAARDLFHGLNAKEFGHLGIHVAFYEIYCGKLFDLLNNRQLLHARENARSNVVIVGLQEDPVRNAQDLMEVIDIGLASRTTGVTGANVDSSRSHAILQISLRDNRAKDNDGKFKEHGKISFIDLAGSERGADTMDTDRQTRMDGAEINKSLLALKECIRALDQQHDHTPFRGSKLTQVLKDSFVGSNCRTVMIANVSPCGCAVEHSLNTLRYAYRVKELRSSGSKGSTSMVSGANDSFTAGASFTADDSGIGAGMLLPGAGLNAQAISGVPAVGNGISSHSGDGFPEDQLSDVGSDGLNLIADMKSPRPPPVGITLQGGAGTGHGDAAEKNPPEPVPAAPSTGCSQAALDELARQHDRLIGTILAEEEELITAHRQHIDMMVELIKEEMRHLNDVDRPGSDVEAYVAGLDRILKLKADYIGGIRERVDTFKEHLHQEDTLSKKFQSLVSPQS